MSAFSSKSKYYYTRLDIANQFVYRSILDAWEKREREVTIAVNQPADTVDYNSVAEYLELDNPGLFYVDFSKISFIFHTSKIEVRAKYIFTDEQINDIENRLVKTAAGMLASGAFTGAAKADSFAKELALHDTLVNYISYDHGEARERSTTIVGGLLARKAVCEGYAKTFKLLCDQIGLSCITVSGTATSNVGKIENHAWNIVKIEGVCSHVDATWDSTMAAGGEICRDNFNITDADISADHTWDRKLYPPCASARYNYFTRTGNFARNYDELNKYVGARIAAGDRAFSIKLLNSKAGKDQVTQKLDNIITQVIASGAVNLRSYSIGYNQARKVASITLS